MDINRNNYEEYFLLYADNELSAIQKSEVEVFVQQNRDLEEEFKMILLTINFPDENVSIANKSFLKKNGNSSFINENNYETIFVLYHDLELSENEKELVEQFLKEFPQFYIDFELIGKSRLTPDNNIIFPDKKLLFREKKTGKVIPLVLWRYIAAAVFVGFGLWLTIYYSNKKEEIHPIAFTEKKIKPLSSNSIAAEKPDTGMIATSATKTQTDKKNNQAGIAFEKEQKIRSEQNKNEKTVAKENEKQKARPEERPIYIEQEPRNEILAATNDPIKNFPNPVIKSKTMASNKVPPHVDIQENPEPAYPQNASYVVDNNSNDENYIFYNIKADEFNKTKVGSFLKKAKRIMERTNPIARLLSGEDKQIASK